MNLQDMAAHSACDFGGGKAERLALAKYRQIIWQGRVLNSQFTDEELRSQGRCPLTPEEIGLLLASLGFDSQTRLYLASHKVPNIILERTYLFPLNYQSVGMTWRILLNRFMVERRGSLVYANFSL